MIRSEIIAHTATRTSKAIDEVENIITTFFDICTEALVKGDAVKLRRFGVFEPRLRKAQTKPNPATGEMMSIPERLSVVFLPSDLLKELLNAELAG